ncbi:MAG: GAF domain-containing protein [Chloroflexota bacterium]
MTAQDLPKIRTIQAPEDFHEDLFANIKVNWKLNALIFVMVLGTIGVFLAALRGLTSVGTQQNKNYEVVLLPLIKTSQVNAAIADIQTALIALQNENLLPAERTHHIQTIRAAEEQIKPIIDTYAAVWLSPVPLEFTAGLRQTKQLEIEQKVNALQASELASFNRFTSEYATYSSSFNAMVATLETGELDIEANQDALSALASARTSIEQLIEINNDFSSVLNEMIEVAYQDVIVRMILALLLAIIFGLFLSYSIARSISKRLQVVQSAAQAMEDGYLDKRAIISIGGNDEISSLAATLNNMSRQLQETLTSLEQRVQERTRDLASANKESNRRAKQFEAITLVSSAISSIRSLDELLPKITQLISQEFGYYHVGIFLSDDRKEYALLRAANSEGGQHMLERGHRLKIGEQGIVGYTTGSGNPRIALDVGEDAVFFENPDLPQTRSEIALPLRIGKSIVGALDVQSTEPTAFGEEDVRALSLLADQVSLAIENARLFDQARKSLDEAETVYRQYIRQAWNRLPKEQKLAGIIYTAEGVSQVEKPSDWQMIERVKGLSATDEQTRLVSIPIEIRGEHIGTLDVHLPLTTEPSADQLNLIKAIADRVAISAENARLFEETARRAERERLVSDITTKIRSASDPDDMIRIALDELKTALGATQVQLLPHTLLKQGPTENNNDPN